MAIKQLSKTIGGVEYKVTQFPALRAIKVKIRIAKLLSPVIAKIMPAIGNSKGGLGDLDLASLEPAFNSLAEHLEPEEFSALCLILLSCTIRNDVDLGNETAFNDAFTGRLGEMYKAIWFVLEANDFFGLGDIGKLITKEKAPVSPQLESSTKA